MTTKPRKVLVIGSGPIVIGQATPVILSEAKNLGLGHVDLYLPNCGLHHHV